MCLAWQADSYWTMCWSNSCKVYRADSHHWLDLLQDHKTDVLGPATVFGIFENFISWCINHVVILLSFWAFNSKTPVIIYFPIFRYINSLAFPHKSNTWECVLIDVFGIIILWVHSSSSLSLSLSLSLYIFIKVILEYKWCTW